MIKIEIKSIFGSVLFTHEKPNNTIRETLIKAVKKGANLDGANLDGANLTGANLTRANLTGANLDGANLDGANLDGANLTRANLTRANLDGANLTRANLDGANLDGANLTRAKMPIWCKWSVTHSSHFKTIYIGCKENTIKGWDKFFASKEVYSTERGTDDFKRIRANYEAIKAYCKIMSSKRKF